MQQSKVAHKPVLILLFDFWGEEKSGWETSIFDPGNSGKQYYPMKLVDHVHYSGQKWNDLQRFS